MSGVLLSILIIGGFLAAWIFSFLFLKNSAKGKNNFFINLGFFAIYTAGSWYAMSEASGWGGLGIFFIWGIGALVHTLILFIVALVVKKRAKTAQPVAVDNNLLQQDNNNYADTFDYEQKNPVHVIKAIIAALGFLHLYKIIAGFTFISIIFSGGHEIDWQIVLYFFDLIFLPIVLICLWLLKNVGRILLWIWFAHVLVSLIYMIIEMISLGFFMPALTLVLLILKMALSATLVYLVSKPGAKEYFK